MSDQTAKAPGSCRIEVHIPWNAVVQAPTEEELAGRTQQAWLDEVVLPAIRREAARKFEENLLAEAEAELVADAEALLIEEGDR